jgi:hypothetical protein
MTIYAGLDVSDKTTHICVVERVPGTQYLIIRHSGLNQLTTAGRRRWGMTPAGILPAGHLHQPDDLRRWGHGWRPRGVRQA